MGVDRALLCAVHATAFLIPLSVPFPLMFFCFFLCPPPPLSNSFFFHMYLRLYWCPASHPPRLRPLRGRLSGHLGGVCGLLTTGCGKCRGGPFGDRRHFWEGRDGDRHLRAAKAAGGAKRVYRVGSGACASTAHGVGCWGLGWVGLVLWSLVWVWSMVQIILGLIVRWHS